MNFTTRLASASFPLSLASAGERVRIVDIRDGHWPTKRLVTVGLIDGMVLDVTHRQNTGAVVLSTGSTRFNLRAEMAHQILVTRV